MPETESSALQNAEKLSLYYYDGCYFCRTVLYEIAALGLSEQVEKRNIYQQEKHLTDLVEGGGKRTVPCLLSESEGKQKWIYESRDIINFLNASRI